MPRCKLRIVPVPVLNGFSSTGSCWSMSFGFLFQVGSDQQAHLQLHIRGLKLLVRACSPFIAPLLGRACASNMFLPSLFCLCWSLSLVFCFCFAILFTVWQYEHLSLGRSCVLVVSDFLITFCFSCLAGGCGKNSWWPGAATIDSSGVRVRWCAT